MIMYDGRKIIPGLILFLGLVTYPVWHNLANGKSNYVPKPKPPADKKECIEPKEAIRINHKTLLERLEKLGGSERREDVRRL